MRIPMITLAASALLISTADLAQAGSCIVKQPPTELEAEEAKAQARQPTSSAVRSPKKSAHKADVPSVFAPYATGLKFESNRVTYRLMPGVFAQSRSQAPQTEDLNLNNDTANQSTSLSQKVIATKSGLQIVVKESTFETQIKGDSSDQSAEIPAPSDGERLVVYNPRSKQVGVVMGTVQVKYQPGTDVPALAARHDATLATDFKAIGFAIFMPKNASGIFDLTDTLRADSQVILAEIEVLENTMRLQ